MQTTRQMSGELVASDTLDDEPEVAVSAVSTPTSAARESLRRTVMRGISWELSGQFGMQAFRFASNWALTRLLAPSAFGVMGMTQAFMMSMQLLADVGLQSSVIHHPRGEEDEFLDTVWTVSTLRGCLLWLIACVCAYPFAIFYKMPELVWILPVTGLASIFRGMASTSLFTASRRLNARWYVLVDCGSQIVGASVTVILTWWIRSVLALACGAVVTSMLYCMFSFWGADRRPHRFRWDRDAVRSLSQLGRWVWLSGWITIAQQRGDRLALGRIVLPAALGNYVIGANLAALPLTVFYRITLGIAQPLYARIREMDPSQFRRKIRYLRMGLLATHVPALACLVIFGQPFVDFIYQGDYRLAGWFCALASLAALSNIATDLGPIFVALGDGPTHFLLTAARTVSLVIGMALGYVMGEHVLGLWWGAEWFGLGANGLLYGIIAAPFLIYPYQAYLYRKINAWLPEVDAFGMLITLLLVLGQYLRWF